MVFMNPPYANDESRARDVLFQRAIYVELPRRQRTDPGSSARGSAAARLRRQQRRGEPTNAADGSATQRNEMPATSSAAPHAVAAATPEARQCL